MDLKKHIIDTIKEWQLKIGYREGNMKLYYPGESLAALLGIAEEELTPALTKFCEESEPQLGRIKISGSYERYCLEIPPKGCAYVAGKVAEPEFLKAFLDVITKPGSTMEQIRECFGAYAVAQGCDYIDEETEEEHTSGEVTSEESEVVGAHHVHSHTGHAFYFSDEAVEEYVYWVEENEFGLTYHRFTRADYEKLR